MKNAQAAGLRILLIRMVITFWRGSAGAREQDGEADGTAHEDDGGVGGQLGEEVGSAARAEGRLRALTAECTGEVG
jgi:hypothetical protein